MKELRYFGPPGTGKSTLLATEKIPAAAERYGSDKVIVTSFTRAAAEEISQKKSMITGETIPIIKENIGTLHSLCYRSLGQPKLAEDFLSEWNSTYRNLSVGRGGLSLDDGIATEESSSSSTVGTKLLNKMDILRAKMVDRRIWPDNVSEFANKWEAFKKDNDCLDFTDLIETCLKEMPYAPNNPSVMFIDEAQDFVPLQLALIRSWGIHMDWHVLTGDDDQASVQGVEITTDKGQVKVEDLVPGKDKLTSYDFTHSVLTGTKQGYDFQKQESYYDNKIVHVNMDTYKTKTTHNHPWIMRWNRKAKDKHIVYLMRKGASFRVGWCKLIRSDGCCHFYDRCRKEKADAGWILKVCDSRAEASMWESYISTEFGLCLVIWTPQYYTSSGHSTPYVISTLYKMLGDHTNRAIDCLEMFDKDIKFPFYIRGKLSKYGKINTKVKACNLFPKIMDLPVVHSLLKREIKWEPIKSIERIPYSGLVYGLNVEPHHNYISDNIITHNCIYYFTGANPDAFINPPIDDKYKLVLSQSYRVPRAVFNKANTIIKKVLIREPKVYSPRDADGIVRLSKSNYTDPINVVNEAIDYANSGKSVMFLASCAYMLDNIKEYMIERAIPFHNPYRIKRSDWNPLSTGIANITAKDLLISFLSKGTDDDFWSVPQLYRWSKYLKVSETGLIRKKGKKMITAIKKAMENSADGLHSSRHTVVNMIHKEGIVAAMNRDVDWLLENIHSTRKKALLYPISVLKKHGEDVLAETPKIILGTIHSVKGGEADIVYLMPDVSYNAAREMNQSRQSLDSAYRLFYVGMTRAREELILMSPRAKRGRLSPHVEL